MKCPDLPRARAKFQEGPHDMTGAGWERYYDQTPLQREDVLSEMLRVSTSGSTEQARRFARGWLDAHRAALEVLP